jgi:L,D-transpeptidase YcbB
MLQHLFRNQLVSLVPSSIVFAARLQTAALCGSLLLLSTPALAQQKPDTIATTLLRGAHPWLGADGRISDVQRVLRDLRNADSTRSLRWSTSAGVASPTARAVLAYIASNTETSKRELADVSTLDTLATRFQSKKASAAERELFDVAMDVVSLRHAYVHRQGRVDPSRVHAEWSLASPELDGAAVLTALASNSAPQQVFTALEPQTRHYQMLVEGLLKARSDDADSTLEVPAEPRQTVRNGGRYDDAPALARILVALGELPKSFDLATVRNSYSRPLADAVTRWRQRKLKRGRATGQLDAATVALLVHEYDTRADRLALAVERWRWLPRTFSNEPLVVNLPEFRLHTYARFEGDSADKLSMNVVIGRADSNATPVFSANMTQVVFSPQWHVPTSIMKKEILPAATRDGAYLARHDYELTNARGRAIPSTPQNIARIGTGVMVRQKSGDGNSLGKVKFLLPNEHAIYLHDTPSRSLFSRVRRDFSHGCVRLGNPMALARYVLGSQPVWTDSRITEAMNAGTERFVRVPRPIPVLIVYQTAVAEPDGTFRYFNDVYGHDRTLADAMEKAK